ncbi:MAG: hypothetical protein AAF707_03415 [Pseudomonadota bacterium]
MRNAGKSTVGKVFLGVPLAVIAISPLTAQDTVQPPPPIRTVETIPPPAPPVINPARTDRRSEAERLETVFVRITGDGKELWSGDLVLQGYRGASVKYEINQVDVVCGESLGQRRSNQRTGLDFSLRYNSRQEGDPFSLNVRWNRQSADCSAPGTKSVGLDVQVSLTPGERSSVSGDGGLQVELVRRR